MRTSVQTARCPKLALLLGMILLWPACERKHTNPLDPESRESKARPATPAAPQAESGIGRISIRWPASEEEDVIGYRVYRSERSDGDYEALLPTDARFTTGETEYRDEEVSVGQTYYYKLSAVSQSGLESARSSYVYARPLSDQVAPGAPRDLLVSLVAGEVDQVRLAWLPPLEDADGGNLTGLAGYKVYRSTDATGSFFEIADVVTLDYTDTGLSPNITYSYRAAAYDRLGNLSERSTSVTAFIKAVSPPTGITATAEPRRIRLQWDASTDPDAAGYAVYRASTPDGDYAVIPGLSETITTGETVFYDTQGLRTDTTYYYRIASVSRAGVVGEQSPYVYAQLD